MRDWNGLRSASHICLLPCNQAGEREHAWLPESMENGIVLVCINTLHSVMTVCLGLRGLRVILTQR